MRSTYPRNKLALLELAVHHYDLSVAVYFCAAQSRIKRRLGAHRSAGEDRVPGIRVESAQVIRLERLGGLLGKSKQPFHPRLLAVVVRVRVILSRVAGHGECFCLGVGGPARFSERRWAEGLQVDNVSLHDRTSDIRATGSCAEEPVAACWGPSRRAQRPMRVDSRRAPCRWRQSLPGGSEAEQVIELRLGAEEAKKTLRRCWKVQCRRHRRSEACLASDKASASRRPNLFRGSRKYLATKLGLPCVLPFRGLIRYAPNRNLKQSTI